MSLQELASLYVAASKDDNLPPIHKSMEDRFEFDAKNLLYKPGDGSTPWKCSKLNAFQREFLSSVQAIAWLDESEKSTGERKDVCMDAYRQWRRWGEPRE